MSQRDFWILTLCIALSLVVKATNLESPYQGFHVFRQIQTLYAIEDYVHNGVDLLNGRFTEVDHLEPITRVLEFPFFQVCAAWASQLTDDIILTSRIVNLFFAVATTVLIFFLGGVWFGKNTGLYSAIFFSFAPINLLYHASLLVDISAVASCILANYCLLRILQGRRSVFLYTTLIVSGATCILIKGLYLLPLAVVLILQLIRDYRSSSLRALFKRRWGLFALFAFWAICLFTWIALSESYSGGGILSHLGWEALLQPVFYGRLAYRMLFLMLNPLTAFFAFIGLICVMRYPKLDGRLAVLYTVVAYYLLFPSINNPHDYYSLVTTPYLCMLAGAGAAQVEKSLGALWRLGGDSAVGFRVAIWLLASVSSVIILLFSISSGIVSFNYFEHKRIEAENAPLRRVLARDQFVKIYVESILTNPLGYVKNRTDILKLYFGLVSPEEVARTAEPLFDQNAFLYALRQRGHIEFTKGQMPQFDEERELNRFHGRLRYVLFYRYGESAREQIKEALSPWRPLYVDARWLVFDRQLVNPP